MRPRLNLRNSGVYTRLLYTRFIAFGCRAIPRHRPGVDAGKSFALVVPAAWWVAALLRLVQSRNQLLIDIIAVAARQPVPARLTRGAKARSSRLPGDAVGPECASLHSGPQPKSGNRSANMSVARSSSSSPIGQMAIRSRDDEVPIARRRPPHRPPRRP
jgi:hypothetical protein